MVAKSASRARPDALGLRTCLKCRNMQQSQLRFKMCAVPMARRMSHFLPLLPMPKRILYHPGMSQSSHTMLRSEASCGSRKRLVSAWHWHSR
jgi:hypothetical protein